MRKFECKINRNENLVIFISVATVFNILMLITAIYLVVVYSSLPTENCPEFPDNSKDNGSTTTCPACPDLPNCNCNCTTPQECPPPEECPTPEPIPDTTPEPPHPQFLVTRDDWGADQPRGGIAELAVPIKRIIVAHTRGNRCVDETSCKEHVKALQINNFHLADIPYNFLIGGDGKVYEGRGFQSQGQHTKNAAGTEYDSIGICIAFIGNYDTEAPSEGQLEVLNGFIEHYMDNKKIDRDCVILSQDDLRFTHYTADKLNEAVRNLDYFYPLQRVYCREEWEAAPINERINQFDRTLDRVMLTHVLNETCSTMEHCAQMCRAIQKTSMGGQSYVDIEFNFVIGGSGSNGFVFEARGWDSQGFHTPYYNDKSVGIAAIGNFESLSPGQGMLDALQRLMDDGVALGKLMSDYRVSGRQDFGYAGPGEAFMQHVREWERYGNRTGEQSTSTTTTTTPPTFTTETETTDETSSSSSTSKMTTTTTTTTPPTFTTETETTDETTSSSSTLNVQTTTTTTTKSTAETTTEEPETTDATTEEPTTDATTDATQQPSSDFMVSRSEWGAAEPLEGIPSLIGPTRRIIIAHTGGSSCVNENDCKQRVKAIQSENSHLDDIPYNFLIGGDGKVYEGRGFEYEGQHTANKDATEYNSVGICIAFIGNFRSAAPSVSQLDVLNDFIEYFVGAESIDGSYIVVSQDDLMYTSIRADALNDAVMNLDHFYPLQKVYRREEWEATSRTESVDNFNHTIDRVMLTHTLTDSCSTMENCAALCRYIQQLNLENDFLDFTFNFAIGGVGNNGFVFEGRGWDIVGAHMLNFNSIAIGIAAIGDFETISPGEGMLDALQRMMDDARALGKLTDDYRVNGRQDFGYPGPGEAFMRHVREWCRYGNRTEECSTAKRRSTIILRT